MPQPVDIQREMVRDANTILKSIDFLSDLIDKKLDLFDVAIEAKNDKDIELLKVEIQQLVRKLKSEEGEMDRYMVKYKALIKNEKEKMLHNPK
jgi:hypothetical protein